MTDLQWRFDHSYARLPEAFFSRQSPARPSKPNLLIFNEGLARELGLGAEGVDPETIAAQLSGASLPQGALPIAHA